MKYIAALWETASGRLKEYDLTQEGARLAHHQGNIAALDESLKSGEMVSADAVEKLWGLMVLNWRAKALSLPTKIALILAGRKSVTEIQEVLSGVMHESLTELSLSYPEEYKREVDEVNS